MDDNEALMEKIVALANLSFRHGAIGQRYHDIKLELEAVQEPLQEAFNELHELLSPKEKEELN